MQTENFDSELILPRYSLNINSKVYQNKTRHTSKTNSEMTEFITLPVLMNGLVYTDETNVKISQNNVRLRKNVFSGLLVSLKAMVHC